MHGGPPPFSGGAGPGPGPMMMMPPAHLQQQQYELVSACVGVCLSSERAIRGSKRSESSIHTHHTTPSSIPLHRRTVVHLSDTPLLPPLLLFLLVCSSTAGSLNPSDLVPLSPSSFSNSPSNHLLQQTTTSLTPLYRVTRTPSSRLTAITRPRSVLCPSPPLAHKLPPPSFPCHPTPCRPSRGTCSPACASGEVRTVG